MSAQIVVVGSLNADYVVRVNRFPRSGETVLGSEFALFPGGKGANQAHAAARLGGKVSMLGQVGLDPQGKWLKEELARSHVDVSHVGEDPGISTGLAVITIDASGQNKIVVVPGANATFSRETIEQSAELIHSAAVLLLQLEIPVETVEAAAAEGKRSGAVVILDPAPAGAATERLLARADYVTPNDSELMALADLPEAEGLSPPEASRLARQLLSRGGKKVIVKMGSAGALLVEEGRENFWPSSPVVVVDSTAAGDAFNAGFAVGLAEGMREEEAGRFAAAVAACSVAPSGSS